MRWLKSRSMVHALVCAAVGLGVTAVHAQGEVPRPVKPGWQPVSAERPRIDVVFALDTTGSMASLIAGAKQKIWSLANQIASGQPRPIVRFGLVGYRDIGDAYVTRVTPLTSDMDALFEKLQAFEADGGGDTPEHVNRALSDAIHRVSWGHGQKLLKLVFLVGDAPPHEDYDDGLSSAGLARLARQRGIVINTIVAGAAEDTSRAWQRIASLAGGEFFAIQQTGNMAAVSTPFDAELTRLNRKLAETTLAYGSRARQQRVHEKIDARRNMRAEVAASAASFSAKAQGAGLGEGDLIADVENGKVTLERLDAAELPAALREMSPKQRRAHLDEQTARRRAIQQQLARVSEQRDRWLKTETAKQKGQPSLDSEVMSAVKSQASRRIGVAY